MNSYATDPKQKLQTVVDAGLFLMLLIILGMILIHLLSRYSVYHAQHIDKMLQPEEVKYDESRKREQTEKNEQIQVKILNQDYKSEWHSAVSITSSEQFRFSYWRKDEAEQWKNLKTEVFDSDEVFETTADCMELGDLIWIRSDSSKLQITSISRADGYPDYNGSFYLYREKEGIVIVNEVPLEKYLYSVVSSEIPSDYPIEAQKAQAVCARTYALQCMERTAGRNLVNVPNVQVRDNRIQTDLNDSVSYQVYNNYGEHAVSRQAVDATVGEKIAAEEVLYYSTSCLSEARTDLNTEEVFADFLKEQPGEEAEYGAPWIRWNTTIDLDVILKRLSQECAAEVEKVEKINIVNRKENGQLKTLEFEYVYEGKKQSVLIEGEYQIRKILSPEDSVIYLADGSQVEGLSLLPSAFMIPVMAKNEKGNPVIQICGGGYGHGIGMSQNGAAAMAAAGADYKAILRYYYDAEVISMSGARGNIYE